MYSICVEHTRIYIHPLASSDSYHPSSFGNTDGKDNDQPQPLLGLPPTWKVFLHRDKLPLSKTTCVLSVVLPTPGAEVCYSHLGCFSDEKPWAGTSQRPIKSLPSDPKKINTRFLLYTNENQNSYQVRIRTTTKQGCGMTTWWAGVGPMLEPSHGCLGYSSLG